MYLSVPLKVGWYVVTNAFKFTVFERFFEDILRVHAIPTYRSTDSMIEEESDGKQLWEECEGQTMTRLSSMLSLLHSQNLHRLITAPRELAFAVSRIPDSASSKALHF